MTINFYINRPSATKESGIYLYVRGIAKGKTIVVHTGESILSKHWDKSKQRAKRSYIGSPELNSFLVKIQESVKKTYRTLALDQSDLAFNDVKKAIEKLFANEVSVDYEAEFFSRYEEFIKVKSINCKANTVNKHKSLVNHLRRFAKQASRPITYENIDQVFYDDFSAYMWQVAELTNNTLGKYLTAFKTFLNWSYDRKFTSNVDYRKYTIPTEKIEIVYLSELELMQLYDFDFSDFPTLEKVRDVFCFQTFTGQRFSDVADLEFQDTYDGVWHLRTTKTKDVLKIPLSRFAREILQKYQRAESLPIMSHQKTNQYIKAACEQAGIVAPITITRYRAKEKLVFTEPKCRFVSTHTARRTFITLSLEKGLRAETVMKISGHTSYKEFKKYIVLTDKVAHNEILNAWS